MDIHANGRAYGIIFTDGPTDRQAGRQAVRLSNKVGRICVRNFVHMHLRTDGRADRHAGRLSS